MGEDKGQELVIGVGDLDVRRVWVVTVPKKQSSNVCVWWR